MRESLEQAIKNAIVFECLLPHKDIDKSCLTCKKDVCLKNEDPMGISKVIYNGIVEFAVNEFDIDYDDLEKEQRRVILSRIRYNSKADEVTKLRYGFYGEVLLDLILRVFCKTNVIAARGYFYSPIENSEPKGFDAFHLLERNEELELWFGEAKFYSSYKKAIRPVLEKLETSLSDDYLRRNLIAIITEREHISAHNPHFDALLDSWMDNPSINLIEEMKLRNMRLVYPIFIAYEKLDKDDYFQSIKKCIDYISEECAQKGVNIPATFDYKLFFIFLPMSKVKQIKERVIQWIDSEEPLI